MVKKTKYTNLSVDFMDCIAILLPPLNFLQVSMKSMSLILCSN